MENEDKPAITPGGPDEPEGDEMIPEGGEGKEEEANQSENKEENVIRA